MENIGTNKKIITISELKTGMILAKEILSGKTVLVNRGVIITEVLIKKLKEKLIVDKIEVFSDEEGKIDLVKSFREKTIEEIEESFKEFSVNVEDIFKNINKNGLSDIKELKEFATKIEEELSSARTVIKNVVLNGSGKDLIFRHSVNVAALSFILGKWIGLNEKELENLTLSAILHDYGKTRIDKNIIEKTEKLSVDEIKTLRSHPLLGYNVVKGIANLDESIGYGILMHHERLDGSGYPMGIIGEKIHPFGRIIAIADTFDEINSNRAENSKSPFYALEKIKEECFGKLDFGYSNVFFEHVINFYIGEDVLLNNNKRAKIIQVDSNDLKRCLLLDDSGFINLKEHNELYIVELLV